MKTRFLACAAASFLFAHLANGVVFEVGSANEVAGLLANLAPGDTVVMKDGDWKDQAVHFRAEGREDRPITLKAQTPGGVVMTGKSSLTIDGTYVVASGICVRDGGGNVDGIAVRGAHCRLTESAVINGTYKFFIHIYGVSNRVDHCYVTGKTSEEPTFQIEAESKPNYHRVDHNHFGPRAPLGKNGGETMRVGYSWQSMSSSCSLVELNLFDRCDGELEVISSKSCGNIYRNNTFMNCAGMLTLRHGNRCVVEGNIIIANHKRGSGGIRVIGEDHVVINNYIDGVQMEGFRITSGIIDSPLKGYFQAKNCLIAFNTVVDSRGPALQLDAGINSSQRTLRPENITIANNVFEIPEGGSFLHGKEGEGWHWMGNIAQTESTGPEHEGVQFGALKLERGADGLMRPTEDSPVKGGAKGDFPIITTDIDGQSRGEPKDAGCDQISTGPIVFRPLTAADVGPKWFEDSEEGRESWRRGMAGH